MTTAIITGASSGIGAAVAERLADDGTDLVLVGRDQDRLNRTLAAVQVKGVKAVCVEVDARDTNAAAIIAKVARETFETVDVLVNNAGVAHFGAPEEMSISQIDETLEVHVRFPYLLTAQVLPFINRGGSILFVGSNLAHYGMPGSSIYSASKGAVEALARTLAVELGPRGIRVNTVSPGITRTPMTAGITENPEAERAAIDASPVGRLGTPAELADAIAFLCASGAGYVNGVSLIVDGGRHLL